jgi:hypothetical protein
MTKNNFINLKEKKVSNGKEQEALRNQAGKRQLTLKNIFYTYRDTD